MNADDAYYEAHEHEGFDPLWQDVECHEVPFRSDPELNEVKFVDGEGQTRHLMNRRGFFQTIREWWSVK